MTQANDNATNTANGASDRYYVRSIHQAEGQLSQSQTLAIRQRNPQATSDEYLTALENAVAEND